MSLLTQCPACSTLYRVVPDQLRISQGWVKCGQCAEIFDAAQSLIEASTDAAPEPHSRPPAEEALDNDFEDTAIVVQAAESEGENNRPPEPEPEPEPEPHVAASAGPEMSSDHAIEDDTVGTTESDAPVDDVGGVNMPAEPSASEPQAADRPDLKMASTLEESQASPDWHNLRSSVVMHSSGKQEADAPDSVSFLVGAERMSFWRSRKAQMVLSAFALVLFVALSLQWIFHNRERLVAIYPGLRPTLEVLCTPVRCVVGPYQHIDSVAIDAAAFNKVGGDSYRLGFSLKNTSALDVAVPHVELSLTDSQDRAVVRRILSPKDLGIVQDRFPAGAEWPVSVAVRVRADAAVPAALGYRLLTFYP